MGFVAGVVFIVSEVEGDGVVQGFLRDKTSTLMVSILVCISS